MSAPGTAVVPWNPDIEESLLGACLVRDGALPTVLDLLNAEDFCEPLNAEAFAIMAEMYGRGDPVDPTTFGEQIRQHSKPDDLRDKLTRIHTLVHVASPPGRYEWDAGIIAKLAMSRRIAKVAEAIAIEALVNPDPEAVAAEAEMRLAEATIGRKVTGPVLLRDSLSEAMATIEASHQAPEAIPGTATGLADLDEILGGTQDSNLIIVAGRPSAGKSVLAMHLAVAAARQTDDPVVVFSLEMDRSALVLRLLCSEAMVDSNRLHRGGLTDGDWPRLSMALERLADLKVYTDDAADQTLLDIRAKCRRLAAASPNKRLGMIVVDYLQLMLPKRASGNRVQDVSEMSRGLKMLAKDLGTKVVAAAQLSRNLEYRSDKRPLLADIRESGDIEANADIVVGIYRDQMYNPDSKDRGTAELHVLKHRAGPTGMAQVAFIDRFTKFADLAQPSLP